MELQAIRVHRIKKRSQAIDATIEGDECGR
jgi:hypothetical protein